MGIIEILKVIIFGIVEGFTEWLPISSTAHLILLQNIIPLNQSEDFFNVFKVVIQLGAILSIVLLYWYRLWPFSPSKSLKKRMAIWDTWKKVIIACIPAAFIGFLINDIVDAYLSTPLVIAITLILYGIFFIILERFNRLRRLPITSVRKLNYKNALSIGLFQCLSLIPGTSRSGATILGGMILGCNRSTATEFSFFLGLPVMLGASLLKIIKYGFNFTIEQIFILISGTFVSFIVGIFSVSFLMRFIKRHDFTVFGFYRIILGILILLWFLVLGH